jgi:hypothetical protein
MRKIPFAFTLIAALSLSAVAQDVKAPTLTRSGNRNAAACSTQSVRRPVVPSLCKPCAFYGGDPDGNDPNTTALANGNTLSVPNTTTYGAVKIPATTRGMITGILFISIAESSGDFDPDTATYDIRTGVSQGNGGSSVASGSGAMSYSSYGQCPIVAYQTAVTLTSPLTVTPGTTYWVNLSPQCTDSGNPNCDTQFFVYNTTQEMNGLHPGVQPPEQMFFNSAFIGYNWTNWCSILQNDQACARLSFGLMGRK